MKSIRVFILLIVGLGISFPSYSQTFIHIRKHDFKAGDTGFDAAWAYLQQGDEWYRKGVGSYPQALAEYLKAYDYCPDQPELNYKIGICFLFTDHKDKAIDHLKTAYTLGKELTPDIYYFLGRAYQYNYQFDKAIKNYSYFLAHGERKMLKRYGARAVRHVEECRNAKKIVHDTLRVKIVDMGSTLNSVYDDYNMVPSFSGEHLYFTSRRPLSKKQLPNSFDNKFEEDIYQSVVRDSIWQQASVMGKPLNTKYNDAVVAVSPDDMDLYIYRGKKKNGSILISHLKKGKWRKPSSALPHINTKGQETSVTFTFEGDTVYFVSNNKKMTHGGKDIFMIRKEANGKWSKPVPLDTLINTPFDEESPFITPDGKTLYFSSKGHNSMGGYDVFRSVRGPDGHWLAPENLGFPVNTPDDDLFYRLSFHDTAIAWISGIRQKTIGLKDLYKVTWLPPPPVDTLTVDILPDYNIPEVIPKSEKTPLPIIVPDVKPWIVTGKVLDGQDSLPVMAAIDVIDMEQNKVVGKTISDKGDGSFRVERKEMKPFGVEINAPGYMFHLDMITAPANDSIRQSSRIFYLKKIQAGERVVLQNIFFEFAKATLKPASYPSLDRVVKFMQDNPDIKVEIDGHTDNIGSDAVNLKLSRARAQAVVNYITSKGIYPKRLVAKGFGESQPVATNNTAEGRAQNRRVEFKILKINAK